jgi:hypothetical protein
VKTHLDNKKMVFRKHNFLIFGIIFLLVILFSKGLFAANILKIGSYTVLPNTECTIQIEAENTDVFVAFQVDIPIPTGFTYVDGSALLIAARITDHAVSASLLPGNILRLIGYSVSNKEFVGNTGPLVSFKLRSGTVPAKYALVLQAALMSDSKSVNVPVTTTNGDVTLQAPNIKLSVTSIDYGRVPLLTTPTQSLQITNDGNKDLIISSLQFNDSQFTTTETLPYTLTAGNSHAITIKFTPTGKATLAKQLQLAPMILTSLPPPLI